MHRSLMVPSLFRSSARAFSTPARTSAVFLTGYSLSVLSSSSFGHSQVGHSIVELSAADLQSIQADDVPESLSETHHFVGSTIVSRGFAQVVDFSDDCVVLLSITLLPHVNDFDIALLNCPQQALVHVVVDLIRAEVWMVKNHLYQVFQLCSVGIVSTEVVLQNAFAP